MSAQTYDVGGVTLPRPFHIQRLGHIGLTHADIDAAAKFYSEELGFRATDALQPPGVPMRLAWFSTYGADHHALVHVNAMLEAGAPGYSKGATVNQISFQVGTLQEVVDGNAYFAEQGVEQWRYGRDFPGSNWATYAYDPDGFRVELFYGIEQIGWDRRSKPLPLYMPPDYVPNTPEPAEFNELKTAETTHGALPPGFRPVEDMPYEHAVGGIKLQRPFAINKVGPVHLFVDDVATSEKFYVDHVGLIRTEEIEWRGQRAVFLRHGPDHHCIGLFPIALRGMLELDPRTKLLSFGVELGSYRQLADAVTWLRGRGITVRTDLPAELRPGIDYAAFVTDASGHMTMLYCGQEQIGWDGKPRPAAQRRRVSAQWPETLAPMSDTYMSLNRQGPMA